MPATPSTSVSTRIVKPGLANQEPLLSIAYPNTCTLTKPLVASLGLRKMAARRIHIVAPTQLGGAWYLDTNPKPGVGSSFPARGVARFRIQHIAKRHFMQMRPLMAPIPGGPFQGSVNVFVNLLHFRLGAEVEGYPGYYHLERTGPVHQ